MKMKKFRDNYIPYAGYFTEVKLFKSYSWRNLQFKEKIIARLI